MSGAYVSLTSARAHEFDTELGALLSGALGEIAFRGTDLIAVVDDDGRFRAVSTSMATLFGRRIADLIGTAIGDRMHPADRAAFEYLLTAGEPSPHPASAVRVEAADGRWRYIQYAVVDCRHVPGLEGGHALLGRDVTETALSTAISKTIRRADGLALAFEIIGGLITEVLPVERVTLGVIEDAGVRFVAASGYRAADFRGELRTLSPPQVAVLRDIRGSLLIKDTLAESGPNDPTVFEMGGTRSYVSTPIFIADQAIGCLACASTTPYAVTRTDVLLLRRVVSSVGASLFLLHQFDEQRRRVASLQAESAQFSVEARTDALTGLPNRRAWDEVLALLARPARSSDPLCVAMLDLDHFKLYNDAYGHQAGDDLLRLSASAWRGAIRRGDLLARYGGEEFGLILPRCSTEDALRIAATLCARTPFGQKVSVGVAQWQPGWGPAELVGAADRALYQAKKSGRDRIVTA